MSNGQIVPLNQGIKNVLVTLKSKERQLRACLPKYITMEKWIGVVTRSITNNPKLLACTEKSLYAAIFQAAQLGLECDGVMHEAYLIPYRVRGVDTVTLIPGYPGLLKLCRNSGQLAAISAQAVWRKDFFEFVYGTDSYLKHIPSSEPPEQEEQPIAYWAAAKLKDGSAMFEVMWPWQVYRIRDKSQGYKYAKSQNRTDTPWIENLPEMGSKSALRKLCKILPKSTEMQRAIRLEEQAEEGEEQDYDFMDITGEEISGGLKELTPAGKLDKLAEEVKAKQAKDPEQGAASQKKPSQKPQDSGTTKASQSPEPTTDKPKAASRHMENRSYADTEADPFTTGELSFHDPRED